MHVCCLPVLHEISLLHPKLFSGAFACLQCNDIEAKLYKLHRCGKPGYRVKSPSRLTQSRLCRTRTRRPHKPEMVSALAVDKRKLSTAEDARH